MQKKIILVLFFVLIAFNLYARSHQGEANQTPASISITHKISKGFAFDKHGAKRIIGIDYIVGKKFPYKGSISFGIVNHVLYPILINDASSMLSGYLVKPETKLIRGVKKTVYKKLGEFHLKLITTKFKERVQVGKLEVHTTTSHDPNSFLVGQYKAFLNVLADKKVEVSNKKVANTSKPATSGK